MRDGITFSLSEADRQRLSDIAAAPLTYDYSASYTA